jgi:pimeloyl-ACP methyl ester carboxylesterase
MSDAERTTTALAQPSSERVTIDGLQLHYLDWGNPAGSPLVCVHGYTSSADAFNGFARHFRDRFHIIALDVRGHGESQWSPDGAYTYATRPAIWRPSWTGLAWANSSCSAPRWAASSR